MRKFSACSSSRESKLDAEILVTPSTSSATSSPNSSLDLLERGERVLDRVVQQPGDDHRLVEPQVRDDARDLERVHRYGSPDLRTLLGVQLGCERVGALDRAGVGVVPGFLQRGDQLVDQGRSSSSC